MNGKENRLAYEIFNYAQRKKTPTWLFFLSKVRGAQHLDILGKPQLAVPCHIERKRLKIRE